MKKIINLLAIIVLGLMLSACSSSSDTKESGFLSGGDSKGSTSGVTLEFAQNNPPSEMFKDQPYTFAFVFKNNQEHAVTDLKLKTKGFDRSLVTGLGQDYSVSNIPKASDATGPGSYSGLIAQGVTISNFEGTYNFNPEFDYCYTAKTSFREQICVPSKLNTCDTDVQKSLAQNGPLTVSIDRRNSIGESVRLDFVVTKSGNGQVVNECFKTDDFANAYRVVEVKLGSTTGNCNPTGTEDYLLGGGKGNFYCEFQRNSDDSYASQVTVELEYLYQQSLKKTIVVEDLTGGLN